MTIVGLTRPQTLTIVGLTRPQTLCYVTLCDGFRRNLLQSKTLKKF